MRENNKRARKQLVFLSLLFVVCLISSLMIYLGSTIFRSQLPFFQLLDGYSDGSYLLAEKPLVNPGVVDLDQFQGMRLYMVMGSDYRPGSGYRTDTIMLIAVDGKTKQSSVVSFPRDLWVSIPGYGEQRINTVMQTGGFQLMANTMQTNFGVYPTQFLMTNMQGFIEIVDILGGVEVETDQYTADACDSSLSPNNWCEVQPGVVSMNSDWALWYVRARYTSSDFDRMRRTQEVAKSIFDKATTPIGLLKLPELMRVYNESVESNINPDQIMSLSRFAMQINSNEVRRYVIGPNETTSWITAEGANILIPNTPAIQAVLQEALSFGQ